MRERSDIAEIKAMLQARIMDLVSELAPGHPRECQKGKYWMPRNPVRSDNRPGSFWIDVRQAKGAWRDEASGDKGDIIDLVQYLNQLPSKGEALKWARRWLNYEAIPVQQRSEVRARAEADRAQQERDAAELAEKNARGAKAWWFGAEAKIEGTLAETYLASRCIHLADLARPPRVLRYLPELKHKLSGRSFPVMMAAMCNAAGEIRAVHRTYLAPDGSDKAPVERPRLVWPDYAGCVIRLTRGETNKSPEEATRRGLVDRLLICEGVEDGLSFALAFPELRIWCAASLNNLANVKLPDCTWEVIVAADNDWGKPQAEKQLRRGVEALAAQRRPVRIARSTIGKDANDALRG